MASCCDHGNEQLVSIKSDEILGFLTYTKNPALVSYVETVGLYIESAITLLGTL